MYEDIKQEIDNKIKTNGNNEITGSRLNKILNDMLDAVGESVEQVESEIGDQVEANPTEPATDSLEKIKIGETIYGIPDPDTSNLATKQELQQGLDTKQDAINDLQTIRNGASAGATAIQGVKVNGNELTPDENEKVNIRFQDIVGGLAYGGIVGDSASLTPDTSCYYITNGAGTYTAFGGVQVPSNDHVQILTYDGTQWQVTDLPWYTYSYAHGKFDLLTEMGGATALQAGLMGFVPAPAAGDQDKILQGNGTWVQKPSDGKSAYQIAVDNGFVGSESEWLASLKANIGAFKFVNTVAAVQTQFENDGVGSVYTSSIDSITADATTLSVILLMTTSGLSPEKTYMIATQDDGNSDFEFVYAGDLQSAVPSDFVSTDDIDNNYDGGINKVAGANEVKQLNNNFEESWKKTPDIEITGFTNGAYSTNGNYSTTIIAKAGSKCKNIDVIPGQHYLIYGTSDANTWYRCCAVFNSSGTRLSVAPAGDYTENPYDVVIPSNGAKMTINLINYNAETDKAILVAESTSAKELVTAINTINEKSDLPIQQIIFSQRIQQRADRYASIMADWMQVVHRLSGMTSKNVISVVASTTNTITLSSDDAACFVENNNPCIARWSDGVTKLVYFDVASGNDVSLMDFDDTDLTDVIEVQSIHDTPRGGGGIHLSQLGYIYLGQWMAEEVVRKISQKDTNLLAGVQFYNSNESTDKKTILNDGLPVAFVDTDMVSGTATEGAHIASYGIVTDALNSYKGGYLYTAYRFMQSKGHYINFTIPACGIGWIEIVAANVNQFVTSTGNIKMEVYVDNTLISSIDLPLFNKRYIFENVTVKGNISVKFSTETADCECAIYDINFYSMSDFIPDVSLQGKKVAMLGDSWTQFPGEANALESYSDYNVVGTRPDGTSLDGLAYFPKEFARVSGAIVDNWGHSNMRADNWGLVKIDEILAYDDYDYLIIEFFINDENAGIGYDEWAANIAKIAEKCKNACVRPIIVCPCLTNSTTMNPYGIRHEMVVRGLGTF